ncbi:MAG: NADH-quinone oxidoreductase subunit NuoE [Candidatus Xenobiia bacterium LiM19]
MLTSFERHRIEEIAETFPAARSALLPALHLIQEEKGHIGRDDLKELSLLLNVPVSEVYGVATFYHMFTDTPRGRYHIKACRHLSCERRGAAEIVRHIRNKTGTGKGNISPDGLFSFEEVDCLGNCDGSPVISINDKFFTVLSEERVDAIIESMKRGGGRVE